jgi:hypothetical protein
MQIFTVYLILNITSQILKSVTPFITKMSFFYYKSRQILNS